MSAVVIELAFAKSSEELEAAHEATLVPTRRTSAAGTIVELVDDARPLVGECLSNPPPAHSSTVINT